MPHTSSKELYEFKGIHMWGGGHLKSFLQLVPTFYHTTTPPIWL
jgi:hypothetical protein